jgi:hypothetical protein
VRSAEYGFTGQGGGASDTSSPSKEPTDTKASGEEILSRSKDTGSRLDRLMRHSEDVSTTAKDSVDFSKKLFDAYDNPPPTHTGTVQDASPVYASNNITPGPGDLVGTAVLTTITVVRGGQLAYRRWRNRRKR